MKILPKEPQQTMHITSVATHHEGFVLTCVAAVLATDSAHTPPPIRMIGRNVRRDIVCLCSCAWNWSI